MTGDGATVELPFFPPYEREKALALIAAHAVPGSERVDLPDFSVTRIITAPSGPVAVRVELGETSVRATVSSGDARDVEAIASIVRAWLDLDLEPSRIVDACGRDPRLGPLVAARPGLRVIGHPDGYEAALTTVLGQQVSLASARTFAGRLVAAYGEPGPDSLMIFPPAAVVASIPVDDLQRTIGLTGARTRTLHAVAQASSDGLDLSPSVDLAATRAALLAIPGVGPWTADYLAVRALGDRDAYPAGDLVLRRALGVRTAAEAERMAEPWRPIRSYALIHIWTAAAFS
ncbi:AlkA N-terminal domain-containing protein [Agreia sp. PsM10]|uniref:DNA-3-methyladenine glycosylase family protein n=1 Tax=Agreia sp. PsM10 TaxID=3030533 RepID=UPI00263A8352|nr:AlkA N-terminal domain-containing protein [Agreia sp. PsM10]MDN4641810.1 AlkA N-terminal domain-containing protein [Agreia sp. PsM10]